MHRCRRLTPCHPPLARSLNRCLLAAGHCLRRQAFENYLRSLTTCFYRRKRISAILAEADELHFRRALSVWDLLSLGIGGIIGAGIFSLTGIAAGAHAGPAVIVSYAIAGFVSLFAALCYSEFGACIPVSGSAYSFVYTSLGELLAWIVGWDLILEYLISGSAVAVGWSAYLEAFFVDASGGKIAGFYYPIVTAPFIWLDDNGGEVVRQCNGPDPTAPGYECGIINLPAIAICLALTIALVAGTKETATLNNIGVSLKVLIILIFVFSGAPFVNTANYLPFVPPSEGGTKYGVQGVFKAAMTVFFGFLGFDGATTVAQEARNPQRDLPLSIMGSLLIATILYMSVATVMVGLVPYPELNTAAPMSVAIAATGLTWLAALTDFGALLGLTTVILISIMGQPRIFASMARDGLMPRTFAKISPRTGTPIMPTILCGVLAAIGAGLLPIDFLANMTSVGTLMAFFLVCLALPASRLLYPDVKRPFKIGGESKAGEVFMWMWCLFGAFVSMGLLVVSSIGVTQVVYRVLVWDGIGIIFYLLYGVWSSNLARNPVGEMDGEEAKGSGASKPEGVQVAVKQSEEMDAEAGDAEAVSRTEAV
ncbi:amino acid permease-domain-containing protein [Hyaloraphidium curvatum]|nr:amino acid permease-domain-containing protein [Hyaloraphidium curvatum]